MRDAGKCSADTDRQVQTKNVMHTHHIIFVYILFWTLFVFCFFKKKEKQKKKVAACMNCGLSGMFVSTSMLI